MGFGSFLKGALKAPITVGKGAIGASKQAAKGNIKGALLGGKSPAAPAAPKSLAAAPDLDSGADLAAPRKLTAARSFRGGRR